MTGARADWQQHYADQMRFAADHEPARAPTTCLWCWHAAHIGPCDEQWTDWAGDHHTCQCTRAAQ